MQALLDSSLDYAQRVQLFLGCARTTHSVAQCYASHDALTVGWALVGALIAYSFVWSILGRNCSKVDQIWSISPVLFAWHFLLHHHLTAGEGLHWHVRLSLLTALVTLWGVRLTYNFYRKGGYGDFVTHEEDYRWPILRKMMHPFVFWVLFNFSFIATYQNVLLFLIAAPAYVIAKTPMDTFLPQDFILTGLFLVFLLIESIADEQHFRFQTYKHSLSAKQREVDADPDVRRGFFTHGLFAFSRHPNYFSEQTMWVLIYLFSANLTSLDAVFSLDAHNWTIVGCLQLIALFQGSITFGESISASKYPEYKRYQERVSRCIFGLPSGLEDGAKKTK